MLFSKPGSFMRDGSGAIAIGNTAHAGTYGGAPRDDTSCARGSVRAIYHGLFDAG